MDDGEDELLAQALRRLPGGQGAQLLIKRLKKNVHEVSLTLSMEPNVAVGHVRDILSRIGREVDPPKIPDSDDESIRVVAGGGVEGLNPVVVTVVVTSAEHNQSSIRLRAAAKEGLIKQRAGEKTARQIQALLTAG